MTARVGAWRPGGGATHGSLHVGRSSVCDRVTIAPAIEGPPNEALLSKSGVKLAALAGPLSNAVPLWLGD
jgi:hypothetical protein